MTAAELNSALSPFLILGVVVLTVVMLLRVIRHRRNRRKVPLLLVRDLMLYGSLMLSIGGSLYSRQTGIRLSEQLWWVALTFLVYGGTVLFWLFVEVALVGRNPNGNGA